MNKILENQVKSALFNAERRRSKLPPSILNMDGMSGYKTRHFYNNILNMPDARYLEIGTWKGSSTCSAMYGNSATITCIDNWSLFGGPKSEFLENLDRYKGDNKINVIEDDCFNVDISTLPKFNIYLYDGDHSEESQYKALTHFIDCLDDMFILIIDDWNWKDVRNGTYRAINDLNLTIEYKKEIRLTGNNSHTPIFKAKRTWWNGIFIAVLSKPTTEITHP
jgi:hypothetical protein